VHYKRDLRGPLDAPAPSAERVKYGMARGTGKRVKKPASG